MRLIWLTITLLMGWAIVAIFLFGGCNRESPAQAMPIIKVADEGKLQNGYCCSYTRCEPFYPEPGDIDGQLDAMPECDWRHQVWSYSICYEHRCTSEVFVSEDICQGALRNDFATYRRKGASPQDELTEFSICGPSE